MNGKMSKITDTIIDWQNRFSEKKKFNQAHNTLLSRLF